jgi:hypothetical protein
MTMINTVIENHVLIRTLIAVRATHMLEWPCGPSPYGRLRVVTYDKQ